MNVKDSLITQGFQNYILSMGERRNIILKKILSAIILTQYKQRHIHLKTKHQSHSHPKISNVSSNFFFSYY